MNYQEAIQYVESLTLNIEKRPGLERIEKFLFCHDYPQNTFKSVHVGGTNGKGSTVAMLECILQAGNYKTGRFIGPHILRLNERFHINGQPIADIELAKRVSQLKQKNDLFTQKYPQLGPLSWFEFLTALAFFYFADNAVDIATIEVGLGGRYDATNVLQNIYATGITNIAFDHERILGSTLEEIAAEKAGIIKSGIPVITGASGAALNVIAEKASQLHSRLIVCNGKNVSDSNASQDTRIEDSLITIKNDICRHGFYQYDNALIALHMLSAADLLEFSYFNNGHKTIVLEKALHALKNFYWPGRFQTVESQHLILDCAHNPACMKSLRDSLNKLTGDQHLHFIFACYADKEGTTMLKTLLRPGDHLYLSDPVGLRPFFPNTSLANTAEELGVAASVHESLADALTEAKAKRKGDEYIIATGSFSVVKGIMQTLGWQSVEDGLS